MKTILIPAEQTDTMVSTLETALLLARKFDSYVEGFALRAALTNLVGTEVVSAILEESFARQTLQVEKEARGLFEGFMQDRNVPRANESRSSLSFAWLENAPEG